MKVLSLLLRNCRSCSVGSYVTSGLNESPELIAQEYHLRAHCPWNFCCLNESPELIAQESVYASAKSCGALTPQ